jgi:hypothetical protein
MEIMMFRGFGKGWTGISRFDRATSLKPRLKRETPGFYIWGLMKGITMKGISNPNYRQVYGKS